MSTPPPAPVEPHPRALRPIPFSIELGDRAASSQADALARAFGRAPARGKQQVRRQRDIYGGLTRFWIIQDIR